MDAFLSGWTERHAAELRRKGCQGVSDSDLIEARLQGAARTRLVRPGEGNEQEARNGSRKLQSDDLSDWLADVTADDVNYDCRDHCSPAQALLHLQALRRALHVAFPAASCTPVEHPAPRADSGTSREVSHGDSVAIVHR